MSPNPWATPAEPRACAGSTEVEVAIALIEGLGNPLDVTLAVLFPYMSVTDEELTPGKELVLELELPHDEVVVELDHWDGGKTVTAAASVAVMLRTVKIPII